MNLHPVVVHFPIAFLSCYAVFELIRFKKLLQQDWWFFVKAVALFAGEAGAALAILVSDQAQLALFKGQVASPLADPWKTVSLHELWAHITLVVFGVLAFGYALSILRRWNLRRYLQNKAWLAKLWDVYARMVEYWIVETPLAVLLALFGLVAVTVAGALGGSIVYGSNNDPLVHLIYTLFIH